MPISTNPSRTNTQSPEDARLQIAERVFALAIILVAFGLRAYHLDYQSLWSDEGISLLRAAQPLGELWRNMPVEHVPGYFILLHFWMSLTGQSDFALRYLSLLPGVFAVAAMMRTGTDFGSRRAGLFAGALLATGAFQVWYAQEMRMYSWLLAAGLLSTWCLWLLFTRSPSLGVWLGYVLSTAAAIYLHYFGFLIPLVHTLVAVLWLAVRRDIRAILYWMAAGAAVFVLFLPWAVRAVALFGFSGWRAPIDPNRIPWLLLQSYTAGDTMPEAWSRWIPLLYLALIVIGVAAWHRRSPDAGLFLTSIAVSAVALTWLLVVRQPDFHVRYTIYVSAPLILLAGAGVAALDPTWWQRRQTGSRTRFKALLRFAPWLVLALLVLANGMALNRLYYDSSIHKPDFRSAAAYIQSNLQPGDILLIDGPNPELVFNHYYAGTAPVYDLRPLEELPDAEVDEALRRMTADAKRAWELLYFKPPGPVQVWLATRGWAADPTYHNNIRVQLVGLDDEPLTEASIEVRFDDALELISSSFDLGLRRPGDLLRISTNWQVHAQAPEYKFSLRLLDAGGGERAAVDYVPQNWFAPTNVWVVGQPAQDRHALLLPDNLEPGPYRVTLRLYDPYSGVPLETAAGVDVPIAEILVADGPVASE